MRTMLVMVAMVVAGCGAEPPPDPRPTAIGTDAGPGEDGWTGLTHRCVSVGTGRLDCDGDGTCETSRIDRSNCGVCGRVCAPPRQCFSGGLCLM